MKPKTVRGSGFRGLLDYQFRIGKPPEIQAKAKMIGGNMAGDRLFCTGFSHGEGTFEERI